MPKLCIIDKKLVGLKKQLEFYRILDYTRYKQGVSFREIGRQTGVHASTFTRLKQGKEIQSFDLFTLFAWLECTNEAAHRKEQTRC